MPKPREAPRASRTTTNRATYWKAKAERLEQELEKLRAERGRPRPKQLVKQLRIDITDGLDNLYCALSKELDRMSPEALVDLRSLVDDLKTTSRRYRRRWLHGQGGA